MSLTLMSCYVFIESEKSPISTIIIRGATDNLMDDIERAIDDGVNAFKALTKVKQTPCFLYSDETHFTRNVLVIE